MTNAPNGIRPVYDDGIPRDSESLTDSTVAHEANKAIKNMTDASRQLVTYYEQYIRVCTPEELEGALVARRIENGNYFHPELQLEGSRDIPVSAYPGPRTVPLADIPHIRAFLLGVARERFRDRGVTVIVDSVPKFLTDVFTYGEYISVSVVHRGILLEQRVVLVQKKLQPINKGNVTIDRVSAIPIRVVKKPSAAELAQQRLKDRIEGASASSHNEATSKALESIERVTQKIHAVSDTPAPPPQPPVPPSPPPPLSPPLANVAEQYKKEETAIINEVKEHAVLTTVKTSLLPPIKVPAASSVSSNKTFS